MIEAIMEAWGWSGIGTGEVISTNEFGHIIYKTDKDEYWRISPEALSCKLVADNQEDYDLMIADSDFRKSWTMKESVDSAQTSLGDLSKGEKYCLKLPLILGGLFEPSNFGKISHEQLITFSGKMAFELKDLSDGSKIEFNV